MRSLAVFRCPGAADRVDVESPWLFHVLDGGYGRCYAYFYPRTLSDLYLVEGLR